MRKKHPEHVNLERWLVSYADFITLLFAFFVIMYAISQADMAKFQKVSQGMRQAFSAGPVAMVDIGAGAGGVSPNVFDVTQQTTGRAIDLPAGKTNTMADEDPELHEMKEKLEEAISLEIGATELSEKLQMQYDSRGLTVRIATKDFFAQGETEVRPDLKPILDRIGRVIFKTKRLVRVEGHTDPSEANTEGFPSDWELSAERAGEVVRYWLSRFNVSPRQLGIAGYSHFRPVSVGKEPWDRGKNRRVEIIILNNRYDSP